MYQGNVYVISLDLRRHTDAVPVMGVYDSKEKAEAAIEYFMTKKLDGFNKRENYEIEEFELNRYLGY